MKLTISPRPTTVISPTGFVNLRAFQIAVPIRLTIAGILSPEFPAILDTGLSHNLSMREEHVQQWVQLPARKTGIVFVNGQAAPTIEADLVLEGITFPLRDGVVAYPPRHPFAPRLPTLGLRALVRNNIRLLIDGFDVTIIS
ncbi:MAG TPA: hypothetical protein VF278_11475 [Pirellulales bacterium]